MKKIDLQLFADEKAVETEDTQTEDTQTEETTETNKIDIQKILNNPEFKKYMESHADQRVTTALAKKEKEYQAKLEEEKRKANLSQEELQAEKEKELAEREQQLKEYELKLAKLDYFKEKGYNIELLDFVGGSDEEEIKTNTDKIIEVINSVVEKQVAERLKQGGYTPPKTGDNSKVDLKELPMADYIKHRQKQTK